MTIAAQLTNPSIRPSRASAERTAAAIDAGSAASRRTANASGLAVVATAAFRASARTSASATRAPRAARGAPAAHPTPPAAPVTRKPFPAWSPKFFAGLGGRAECGGRVENCPIPGSAQALSRRERAPVARSSSSGRFRRAAALYQSPSRQAFEHAQRRGRGSGHRLDRQIEGLFESRMAGKGGMQDLVSETKPGRAGVKFHIRLGCLLLILRIQLPLIMQGE